MNQILLRLCYFSCCCCCCCYYLQLLVVTQQHFLFIHGFNTISSSTVKVTVTTKSKKSTSIVLYANTNRENEIRKKVCT